MSVYHDCILYLLAKAYQKAYACFKKHLHEYGLTPVQTFVVMGISEEEGLSAKELGKRLLLDNATLSGVLDRLAEGGWITKGTMDEDRRFLQLYLSERARGIVDRLVKERDEANKEILGGLRLEEQILLKRMLKDLR
ncbi:MAG: MarR family transcriptional regulator [Syntrophaceae bacterium]